jgi:hypothetical protein
LAGRAERQRTCIYRVMVNRALAKNDSVIQKSQCRSRLSDKITHPTLGPKTHLNARKSAHISIDHRLEEGHARLATSFRI